MLTARRPLTNIRFARRIHMGPLPFQVRVPRENSVGLFVDLLKRVVQPLTKVGHLVLNLLLRIQELSSQQMLPIQIGHSTTLRNLLVHERVGERGLVQLIVAKPVT